MLLDIITSHAQPEDPRTTDPNVRKVIRLWLAFNFFIAPIKDGLNPFVSVYLVTCAGLTPGMAGIIWCLRDVAMMASQFFMGALVDHSTKKKGLILLFTCMCTLAPLTIIFTNNFPILVMKTLVEGVASSGLACLKGPFTLGIGGHAMFDETSKLTEVAEHTGAFFAAMTAGAVAYALYPNVALLFYVIGLFGLFAFFCILLMPTYSTLQKDGTKFLIVNDDLARNADVDDENDGKTKQDSGFRSVLADKNLVYFAMGVFFFHLGNASVLPLLSQTLALKGGREGVPLTAANIVVAQVCAVGAAYMMDYLTTKGLRINVPILIGFGAQAVRIILILILTSYWPNQYAFVATQFFDGIGAGVNGLGAMQVTKALTNGTNRFGKAFSVVNFCGFCGGGLSNIISGYIVTETNYTVGFNCLLIPVLICLVFVNIMEAETAPLDKSGHAIKDIEKEVNESSSLLNGKK